MLPPHERYIEMFAGGLSMFFRKTKAKWNVVNDIDNDVVNLYISVLEEFDKLSEYIYWYPRSRTLFNEIKKEISFIEGQLKSGNINSEEAMFEYEQNPILNVLRKLR